MTVTEPSPPDSAPPVSDRGRDYPGPSPLAVPGLLRKLWFDRLSLLADAPPLKPWRTSAWLLW